MITVESDVLQKNVSIVECVDAYFEVKLRPTNFLVYVWSVESDIQETK